MSMRTSGKECGGAAGQRVKAYIILAKRRLGQAKIWHLALSQHSKGASEASRQRLMACVMFSRAPPLPSPLANSVN